MIGDCPVSQERMALLITDPTKVEGTHHRTAGNATGSRNLPNLPPRDIVALPFSFNSDLLSALLDVGSRCGGRSVIGIGLEHKVELGATTRQLMALCLRISSGLTF